MRRAAPHDRADGGRERRDDERPRDREAAPPARQRDDRLVLLRLRVPRRELLDEHVRVELEGVGIRAQEGAGVGVARKLLEALALERLEVALPEARPFFGIAEAEPS